MNQPAKKDRLPLYQNDRSPYVVHWLLGDQWYKRMFAPDQIMKGETEC